MKIRNLLFALVLLGVAMLGAQTVSNVTFAPRHPWNGLVDITFQISGEKMPGRFRELQIIGLPSDFVVFTGYDGDRDASVSVTTVIGQTKDFPAPGTYTVIWDAAADYPEFAAKDFRIQAQLMWENSQADYPDFLPDIPTGNPNSTYLVIDLSGGSTAQSYPCRYTNSAPSLSGDACRTTELWLRHISAGTFTMGSPEYEAGQIRNETQHQVTLTQDYYIGVFEVTQRQYELVMGSNPSKYQGDTRPVEEVSYDDLRGTSANGGAGWPAKGHAVDAGSFFGVLRAKTGLLFDLPTEAQWEYACRAGTTTALNSGKNLFFADKDPYMAEVGRYMYNLSDGRGGYSEHTKVGCYLPNAWGLYDMHGNVFEWCLNSSYGYPESAVTDPAGGGSDSSRAVRGGGWQYSSARSCRSAFRVNAPPSNRFGDGGFRLVCLP